MNRSKRVASEASTVRITPRRWAPSAVLLVRAPVADFGFAAAHFVRAIVRGLDRRMFDEHEQAVRVVHQLVLQTDEVGHVRRGLIRNDPFAVTGAEWADAVEQLLGLLRATDAQSTVALMTQRLVICLAQLVEKRRIFLVIGVLQRELDRLADQMCPA